MQSIEWLFNYKKNLKENWKYENYRVMGQNNANKKQFFSINRKGV